MMTIVILQTKQGTARIKEQSVSRRSTATTLGSLKIVVVNFISLYRLYSQVIETDNSLIKK